MTGRKRFEMKVEINAVKNEVVVNVNLEGLTYKEVTPDMFNNKKLGKMVENFSKCEGRIKDEQWKAADYMAQMATVDSIKQDFGSDQAFADFMQMSRSDVNKLKRVSALKDVAKNHGLTVSKAYELLPLIGLEDVSIASVLIDYNVNENTTQKELREIVKAVRFGIEEKEEKEEQTEEEETEEAETSETVEEEEEEDNDNSATEYTLPFINDNGDVVEAKFKLKYKGVELLAKCVTDLLDNMQFLCD